MSIYNLFFIYFLFLFIILPKYIKYNITNIGVNQVEYCLDFMRSGEQ